MANASIEFRPEQHSILIVDDNVANVSFLADYLGGVGFRILIARNGESGLHRAIYGQPQLILLDVMMPGMNGFETCQQLKAHEKTKDIPIIFMTALTETADKIKGFEVGAVDYVTKPVQQEEVLARVTTHLRLHTLTFRLQQQNKALSKHAVQLETSGRVGQQISSILEVDKLLPEIVQLIETKFDYYGVSIWLVHEATKAVILRAEATRHHTMILTTPLQIPLNITVSIIAQVARTGVAYLAHDVRTDPKFLEMDAWPYTLTELALPLKIGSQVIGVLDIQHDEANSFDQNDQTVLTALADSIAIAINNAHLYSELTRLNEDKDKFFSILAHDLRGLFTPLLGNAELLIELADSLTPQDMKEMGASIGRSGRRVLELLENLLAWARFQMGRMKYEPQIFDLKFLVDENMTLMADVAANKRILLQSQVTNSLFVYGDKKMIDTVIRNLLNNALKFTLEGGHVTMSAIALAGPLPLVEVTVEDSAVGVDFPRVLLDGGMEGSELGVKVENMAVDYKTAGTAQNKGTGLGLIICKELVECNQGKIWVENELNYGTIVKFTLPLANTNK